MTKQQDTTNLEHCVSDYAGDVKDGKSTSSYYVYNAPIAQSSRKQIIVTTSTAETECSKFPRNLMFETSGEEIQTAL